MSEEASSASPGPTSPSPSPEASSSEEHGAASPVEASEGALEGESAEGGSSSPEGEAQTTEAAKAEYKRLSGIAKRQRELRQREAQLRAREQELAQRETGIKDFERVKQNPAEFFEYASKQGVPLDKAMEHWLASQDPQKRAEMDAKRAKEAEENRIKALEEQIAAQKLYASQQQRAVIESEFLSKFSDESKFEASSLLYTAREKVQKGDEIANLAKARGLRVTFDTIAEAIEILARQDARWTRLQSWRAPKPPPATDTSPPATRAKTLNQRAASEAARPSDDSFADLPLKQRVARARIKGPVPPR